MRRRPLRPKHLLIGAMIACCFGLAATLIWSVSHQDAVVVLVGGAI